MDLLIDIQVSYVPSYKFKTAAMFLNTETLTYYLELIPIIVVLFTANLLLDSVAVGIQFNGAYQGHFISRFIHHL